jgi:hypothetical protein
MVPMAVVGRRPKAAFFLEEAQTGAFAHLVLAD